MPRLFPNPTAARFLLTAAMMSPLQAQGLPAPITEPQAIARTLARPEWRAIVELPSKQGEGASREARTWLSPGLEWNRDRFDGTLNAKREDTFLLTQGVDLSGRWLARREAALKREEAGKAGSALQAASVVAQVREAFFDLVAARERCARLERALGGLSRVQDRVDRLHESGEMSGLDRSRARREVEILKGRQTQELGSLQRAERQLSTLLGERIGQVQGELLPPVPEPLEKLLGDQQTAPGNRMAKAQEEAALADAKAARRWMPELNLGVGVKRWQENGLSGNGSVLSLGFTLPAFGKVKGARVRAEAEARAAGAQARLQREREGAELRNLWQETTELRASAERLGRESLSDAARTESALEAAFATGEMDLLARLDGTRSLLEAQLTAIDQTHRARRASIALDRLLGKVNP